MTETPPPGLSETTQATYEREAAAYDAQRGRSLFERGWLERTLRDVPRGGPVLDLGCGAGEPIGRYLSEQGFALTGADFAEPMLEIFRNRFPKAAAINADMRVLDLGQRFDAIIGWGSFFHLTMDEQRAALPRIADHLNPGGRLLLTVGPGAGEALGHVNGAPVYHASLSEEDYRAILCAAGCETESFAPNDPETHGHTLLLARRK
ncbi:class I SAM-dependent DNA methyltransferase [Pacificoceanicola onchidii]|uniref:class I SAM-dependent DNA methyltransferase n=1 Tax=Pacificoceanicola onchidii TaxID=2562685 RepID=UPI0014561FD5|nr:class I SAM-dependent methyltransferase [Pacificoceanicola onchidii]